MRFAAGLGVGLLFVGVAVTSCGDDAIEFPDAEGGGGAGNEGAVGGAGAGGQGGQAEGGDGGAPPTCDDCPVAAPICHDEECVAACPSELAQCHTDLDPSAADVCCPAGDQCCGAVENGYPTDVCASSALDCPTLCADGVTYCDGFCVLEPQTQQYACVDDCGPERTCGEECCPLGSRCDAGVCALGDITVDEALVSQSAFLDQQFFDPSSCEIVEGCIEAPGLRTLLRFDLRTPNEGLGDMYMGDPSQNIELFEYSPCHGHYHFTTYASYRLLDGNNQVVANGHKQAFCLMDIEAWDPGADPFPNYDCQFQGIQAGWADIYDSFLPCQWVDVTGVPPGDYVLEVSLNTDMVLAESDYTNNLTTVAVTID